MAVTGPICQKEMVNYKGTINNLKLRILMRGELLLKEAKSDRPRTNKLSQMQSNLEWQKIPTEKELKNPGQIPWT